LSTRLNTRWSRDRPKPANFEDSSVHGAVENMDSFCEDRGNCVGETLIYAFRVKSSSAVKGPVQPHRISSTAMRDLAARAGS